MSCTRWIAICADIAEHPVVGIHKPRHMAAWIWMLTTTAWKTTRREVAGKVVTVKRGQLVASRSYIAKKTGLSEQEVRTLLVKLSTHGMVSVCNQGTNVITICNYEKYQTSQPATNQRATSEQPASNHTCTKGTTVEVREETPTGHHQQDAAREPRTAADAKRVDSHDLYNRLVEAANGALCPMAASVGMMAVSEPIGWLQQGADLELDILPAVKTVGHKAAKGSIKTWSYFRQPVAEAKARREKGLPPVNVETGKPVIRCSPGTMRNARPAPEVGHA
jgi:hypothetical protein